MAKDKWSIGKAVIGYMFYICDVIDFIFYGKMVIRHILIKEILFKQDENSSYRLLSLTNNC